jgi:hypothetical protein
MVVHFHVAHALLRAVSRLVSTLVPAIENRVGMRS